MHSKDLVLNADWYEKHKPYHMHPCFLGKVSDVIKDCCGSCPPLPATVPPEEVEHFVSGPLKWIVDNPGRQRIGSFHPITDGDYSEGAYLSETTLEMCCLANANDCGGMRRLVSQGVDVSARDMLGRSPLHLAVIAGNVEAVKYLLSVGIKIAARLTDGRTVLHLAAMYGRAEIATLLLEKNKENEAKAAEAAASSGAKDRKRRRGDDEDEEEEEEPEDDDEDGGDGEDEDGGDGEGDGGAKAEDADVIDINGVDFDKKMSALHYTVALGRVDVLTVLLAAGANASAMVMDEEANLAVSPLELCFPLAKHDAGTARAVILALVQAGVNSKQLNLQLCNVVHMAASLKHSATVLAVLFETDPAAHQAMNDLNQAGQSPLALAVSMCNPESVRFFLNAGAKLVVDQVRRCGAESRVFPRVKPRMWWGWGCCRRIVTRGAVAKLLRSRKRCPCSASVRTSTLPPCRSRCRSPSRCCRQALGGSLRVLVWSSPRVVCL